MKRENWNRLAITVLRVAVGWHFLYEGLSKRAAEDWTAAGFLNHATGPFAGFYHGLASSEALMGVVDFANVYGLIAIGLALFLGCFIRAASASGVVLLTLYYFAYPPFGATLMGGMEGNVFIVNRIFLEAMVLLALFFMQEKGYGLHAVEFSKKPAKAGQGGSSRRESLANLFTLPVLGLMGLGGHRNHKEHGVDVMSGATITVGAVDIGELKGELPKGKLGNHEISRLVLGGNLIGGWTHARDLRYVSKLSRAYNTERKVFETLQLAEQAGINAINIGFPSNKVLKKYKEVTGGKIKVISQVAPHEGDYLRRIDEAIDFGAEIIQVQGNWCDWLVRDGELDKIELMLNHIRKQGLVAGLGAHTTDSLVACKNAGIVPDYYMKTMHHDNYWSAHPRENRKPFEVDGKRSLDHDQFHDNCFCPFPDKTIEFVADAKVPVMGFKVLAAGAIRPEDGFKWAFKNGADFICVGMFDFQLVNDVNITIKTLEKLNGRERAWFA
ncbi:hypothetical protein PDESU_02952 [Pontiella desulfatans]|uniref:DoxX family protein n=1 Tax=Pontiella desulfatans TaxID=2750659 RepID=A0A6C2U4B7_PONDE|nr:DoxX family protein [Pontiella desulfatans]VGO14391.1 hypothetical protein PDESU_02952 [Pontiella desulfatans]